MQASASDAPRSAPPPLRLLRRFLGVGVAVIGLVVLGTAATASASHGRGTTTSVSVAEDGTATVLLDQRTTGSCTPGDVVDSGAVTLHRLDGPGGNRTSVSSYAGDSTCRRTAGDFIETRAAITIPMAAMPDGWYVVRHQGFAKVSNIINVNGGDSGTDWSSEAQFRKVTGESSGSPSFGVDLPFAASIGYEYSQNLAVIDPDGGAVTARSLCCNHSAPDFAVSEDVIAVGPGGVVAGNQIEIPATVTGTLGSGEYLEFKVRVTDAAGEYSELDMVLSPTSNVPPTFEPPATTTIAMAGGTTTTIPLTAADPDGGQRVGFSLSGQPAWVSLNQTAGNPASGTITVSPPPTVSGTFVVNVNANDDDPTLQATSSFALTFVVSGVPDQPQNVDLEQGDQQITVEWDPPVDAGTPVTEYRVEYREAGSTGPFTTIPNATSPTVITGLQNGVQYEVRVIAVGQNGAGAPAPASTSPHTTPGPVSGLTVQPGTTGADVTWQPPAVDGGSPVTAYLLEHRPVGAAAWTAIGEVAEPAVTLSGLVRGVAHEVRVRPLNVAGSGPWQSGTFRTLGIPTSGSSSVVVIRDGAPVAAPLFTGPTTGPLISVAGTPSGTGSWATTTEGHVYVAGDATKYGDLAGIRLNAPITGIAATLTGRGYYLVASDGGVFAFGDAAFHGSMGGVRLNQPVQGLVPTCDGGGYYLVALDGGVFAFGDARFHGSMGGTPLNKGMLGIAPNCERGGYWTFAGDGGVFTFGDNVFYGSLGDNPPPSGVVGMTPMPDGRGYWLLAGNGATFPFGSAAD